MYELEITNLKKTPQLYESAINLIHLSLDYSPGEDFTVDFAPLVAKSNWSNCHLLINAKTQEVLAHVGFLKRELTFQGGEAPVGLLGGICVHPKHRGKGYLRKLMNYVLDHYIDRVAFFILWSDQVELYHKFGFLLSIGQIEWKAPHKTANWKKLGFSQTKFSKLSSEEFESIQEIYSTYCQHNLTAPKRDLEDWQKIKQIESCDLYLYHIDEQLKGYFVINKGKDLSGVIHEVGCDLNVEEEFFEKLKHATVWLPENDKHKTNSSKMLFMGLLKIGDPHLFSDFIYSWSQGRMKILKFSNECIEFKFEEDFFSESTSEFLTLVFGPNKAEELKPLNNPLFFSGLDSI